MTTTECKLPGRSPFLSVLLVLTVLVLVFPIVLLGRSPPQQNHLASKLRYVWRGREIKYLTNYLPVLTRNGPEWRFQGDDQRGGCDDIPRISHQHNNVLGEGYSKRVFSFGDVAIKRVLKDGQGMFECMFNKSKELCWDEQIRGFLNEVALLITLKGDTTVPKLLAYCLPVDENSEFALVMELAQPLDAIYLARLDWHQRVKVALQVVSFLDRIRPLTPMDFRRQQFVVRKDSTILFTDFDSVYPSTSSELLLNCKISLDDTSLANKAYTAFVDGFLTSGAPSSNSILSDLKLTYSYGNLTLKTLRSALSRLEHL